MGNSDIQDTVPGVPGVPSIETPKISSFVDLDYEVTFNLYLVNHNLSL